MNKYTVIVSGGILEEKFALDMIKDEKTELIIGVDKGLKFLYEHQIRPNYIVGDFDSASQEVVAYYKTKTDIPIRQFQSVKDVSDTEIALRLCLNLQRKNIVILGGTGKRIDHLWANVQSLKIALDAGADARIMDSYNCIRLINTETVLQREEAYGPYFSVFPLGSPVNDFNISGAKYPLSHHTLTPFGSMCVSNEFAGEEVTISFPYGEIILMETRD